MAKRKTQGTPMTEEEILKILESYSDEPSLYAVEKSGRTYEEIMAFLRADKGEDE